MKKNQLLLSIKPLKGVTTQFSHATAQKFLWFWRKNENWYSEIFI